ncbi:hypothetical protein R3P38DRAFT_3297967 [Favolaschia claudopus]|uniref:Uncharacterized protein n=1 Tax=Favolaschia claudopus TaxID=2862362 RepID=A0AAV9Z4G4_9AGAR
MPGSDLSLRHLPALSDASFSFQIPADSGDDLLHGDSEDFFGGGTSLMGSPLVPRNVVDAPMTLVDPQATPVVSKPVVARGTQKSAKSLLSTTRPNIQAPTATHTAAKAPKSIPATEMKTRFVLGAATPRTGALIDSEPKDAQESMPRSKEPDAASSSKEKSLAVNLSSDELLSHLPNDSPIDRGSSKDAESVGSVKLNRQRKIHHNHSAANKGPKQAISYS